MEANGAIACHREQMQKDAAGTEPREHQHLAAFTAGMVAPAESIPPPARYLIALSEGLTG
jgi:hypothetical protein